MAEKNVPNESAHFDLVVVVPLPEEHEALQEVLATSGDHSDDEFIVTEYSVGANLRVASVLQVGMGRSCAAETVRYIEQRFDVGVYVLLGIAGSLSDDNQLGDICYSGTIYDVTNNASVTDGPDSTTEFELAPMQFQANERLVRSLAFLRSHPDSREDYLTWQKQCGERRDELVSELPTSKEEFAAAISREPVVRSGPIACGPVTKSKKFKEKLLKVNRQMLAIETECGGGIRGIGQHCQKRQRDCNSRD